MSFTGNLVKMGVVLDEPVQYTLRIGQENILMNDLVGKYLTIHYNNKINCIKCGRQTKTSFAQGYCYPCFISIPETEECVLRPELCQAHNGVARDMEYAQLHCLGDHYVYLADSGGLKVGVTRHSQIPTRWIDQGAGKAIRVAKTANRYTAGIIEVSLKNIFKDKTNWRDMLRNVSKESIDLMGEREKALDYLPAEFSQYIIPDDPITEINYPCSTWPVKIKSANLEKTGDISGVLSGIRGQYLIFDSDVVFNIRRHNGYHVDLIIN